VANKMKERWLTTTKKKKKKKKKSQKCKKETMTVSSESKFPRAHCK
jgi:hypothetical protein